MRKFCVLGVVLAVAVAGVIKLGDPAAATQATVGTGPATCNATLTVAPLGIGWDDKYGWWESGSVTEVGSCRPGATSPVIASGSFTRRGSARDGVTGECPAADFSLQDTRTGLWTEYYEMTLESTVLQSPQIIGINPTYTYPVPFGYGSISERVPTGGVTIAQTDPVACAEWPTAPGSPPDSVPASPFHIKLGLKLPAPPGPGGLLQLCLTLQGVVPRTCVGL